MSNNTGGVGSETNINISNDVPPTPPRRLGSSSYAVFSKVGSMSNLTSGTGGVAGALTPSSALKIHHHSSQHHRHPQPHHITSDDNAADGGKHSASSRSMTISRRRSVSYDSIATRGGISDDDDGSSTRSSRSFIAEILKQDSLMDVNLSAREESDNVDDSDDDDETYPPTIATTSSEEGGGESTITSTTTTKTKKKGKKKNKSSKDKENRGETASQKDSSKLHDQPMASISEVFSFGHHSASSGGGGSGGNWYCSWLSRRTVCFVLGISCSAMAGVVYPASAFILATIFQSISADPNSTNKQDFLNEIAYTTYLYVGLG